MSIIGPKHFPTDHTVIARNEELLKGVTALGCRPSKPPPSLLPLCAAVSRDGAMHSVKYIPVPLLEKRNAI